MHLAGGAGHLRAGEVMGWGCGKGRRKREKLDGNLVTGLEEGFVARNESELSNIQVGSDPRGSSSPALEWNNISHKVRVV